MPMSERTMRRATAAVVMLVAAIFPGPALVLLGIRCLLLAWHDKLPEPEDLPDLPEPNVRPTWAGSDAYGLTAR
jgi:hypothetical protein